MNERDEKNGSSRGREQGGGGWGLRLLKAARAVGGVVNGLYTFFRQSEPEAWTPPKEGWLKLNVYGTIQFGSAGCGGVLRGSSGDWICGFAQKLTQPRWSFSDNTQKEAILRGLQWARDRREFRVVVESDNKEIVDLVNSGNETSDSLIRQIRGLLLDLYFETTLECVPANANGVAQKLADFACYLPSSKLREFNSPLPVPYL